MKQENEDTAPRMLAARTGAQWQDNSGNPEIRKKILSEILLSPNLVILCGLGTTRYLTTPQHTAAAPTMQDLWAAVAADAQFETIHQKISFPLGNNNIEFLLSQCQLWQAISPSQEMQSFVERAEQLIVSKCRFVSEETVLEKHESFLRKVGRRSTRLPRLKLFTTNYDLTIETAARRSSFIVVDGFSHTVPQEFDSTNFNYDFVRREEEREGPEYIPNVFHLYKIHGSVDWEVRSGRIIRGDQPAAPLIIYPRNSKFESSYNPPFLEMMSRLQLALRQPDTGLLVIGLGFNDEHLAQPILAAIRSNIGLKAAIVSPDLAATDNAHIAVIARLIANGDDRLALIASTFEEVIPQLPDLVATTEEEEHRRRLAAAMHRK